MDIATHPLSKLRMQYGTTDVTDPELPNFSKLRMQYGTRIR